MLSGVTGGVQGWGGTVHVWEHILKSDYGALGSLSLSYESLSLGSFGSLSYVSFSVQDRSVQYHLVTSY